MNNDSTKDGSTGISLDQKPTALQTGIGENKKSQMSIANVLADHGYTLESVIGAGKVSTIWFGKGPIPYHLRHLTSSPPTFIDCKTTLMGTTAVTAPTTATPAATQASPATTTETPEALMEVKTANTASISPSQRRSRRP